MTNVTRKPASVEEMLEEIGENENIIVLEDEQMLFVSVEVRANPSITNYTEHVKIKLGEGNFKSIDAQKAFEKVESSYVRTIV